MVSGKRGRSALARDGFASPTKKKERKKQDRDQKSHKEGFEAGGLG